MAQGIYDKLEETYKLLTNLNKQLCCNYTPPPTTTTTSTTTVPPVLTRKHLVTDVLFAGRSMFAPTQASFYSGNTVANVLATNPTLALNDVTSGLVLRSGSLNITRTIRENSSSSFSTIVPDYTFTDGGGNSVLRSIKESYAFANKIINNSFLANRNAQVVIKRVSIPQNFSSGSIVTDGFFLIGIDFDATGQEKDGVTLTFRAYDQVNIPGTINVANFTYLTEITSFSGSYSDTPMTLVSPSTSWVNDLTVQLGFTIREDFPIPPGW